jgi:hypothetical protein
VKFSSIFGFLFIIVSALILILSDCTKKEDCCELIDNDADIHYVNKEGKNLINSSDDFAESNIKVYYKNGNNFEYIYRSNLDAPNMYRLYQDKNGNEILTVYASDFYEGNTSTTLIELNPYTKDTLVCEFDLSSGNTICKKAWLNGVEMQDRFITLVK